MLSETIFLNETKNHNPPCKLNGRSLIEVYVPNQDNEWPCSCVLHLSTILIYGLGTVPTVWYYLAFILFKYVRSILHHRWEKCSLTNTSKKKFKVTEDWNYDYSSYSSVFPSLSITTQQTHSISNL